MMLSAAFYLLSVAFARPRSLNSHFGGRQDQHGSRSYRHDEFARPIAAGNSERFPILDNVEFIDFMP